MSLKTSSASVDFVFVDVLGQGFGETLPGVSYGGAEF